MRRTESLRRERHAGKQDPYRQRGRPRLRPRVERLEDRTLLSDGSISPEQRDVMLRGLTGLADWGDNLSGFSLLGQPLPGIDRAAGAVLPIGQALDEKLY